MGIKIYLNFGVICFKIFYRKGEFLEKFVLCCGILKFEINFKVLYNINNDSELWEYLVKFVYMMGYLEDKKLLL